MSDKIRPQHLSRKAILYIRQSSRTVKISSRSQGGSLALCAQVFL